MSIKKKNENSKTATCKTKLNGHAKQKFMVSTLSSVTDNPAKGLHQIKFNDYLSCLGYVTVNNSLIVFKCADCNKNYEKKFDKEKGLEKIFENTEIL